MKTSANALWCLIEALNNHVAGVAIKTCSIGISRAVAEFGADIGHIALLAMMLVVLVGAMLTPTLLWAARQPLVRRSVAWAVLFGIRWLLWQVIRRLLFPQPLE
jgi:hypothetical protein